MPNYAHMVDDKIWKWSGDYYWEDGEGNWEENGPYKTKEEALAAYLEALPVEK